MIVLFRESYGFDVFFFVQGTSNAPHCMDNSFVGLTKICGIGLPPLCNRCGHACTPSTSIFLRLIHTKCSTSNTLSTTDLPNMIATSGVAWQGIHFTGSPCSALCFIIFVLHGSVLPCFAILTTPLLLHCFTKLGVEHCFALCCNACSFFLDCIMFLHIGW